MQGIVCYLVRRHKNQLCQQQKKTWATWMRYEHWLDGGTARTLLYLSPSFSVWVLITLMVAVDVRALYVFLNKRLTDRARSQSSY